MPTGLDKNNFAPDSDRRLLAVVLWEVCRVEWRSRAKAKLIAQAQQSTSSGCCLCELSASDEGEKALFYSGFSSGGFSASSAPNPAPAEGFGERRKEMLQNGVASLLLLADVVFQRRLVGNHLHPPPGPGGAIVSGKAVGLVPVVLVGLAM